MHRRRACAGARASARCARVATDEIERLNRNVQLVAVCILEQQELAREPADVERPQAYIAAHAVLFVDDGRPGVQVREIANDLFGIAFGAPTASLLTSPLAKQLFLRDEGDVRILEHEASGDGRNSDRERR